MISLVCYPCSKGHVPIKLKYFNIASFYAFILVDRFQRVERKGRDGTIVVTWSVEMKHKGYISFASAAITVDP